MNTRSGDNGLDFMAVLEHLQVAVRPSRDAAVGPFPARLFAGHAPRRHQAGGGRDCHPGLSRSMGSCKHPPARLLSRNIACAANVSRRHSPNGPTTARGVACDAISATLAAYLAFEDPADPSTAAVDFAAAKGSLRCPAARALLGRSLSSQHPGGKTPCPSQPRTPDRTQARTDLYRVAARKLPPLRDSSLAPPTPRTRGSGSSRTESTVLAFSFLNGTGSLAVDRARRASALRNASDSTADCAVQRMERR